MSSPKVLIFSVPGVVRALGWTIAFLLLASTISRALNDFGVQPNANSLFDVDKEKSIPAFFSALELFTAAVLLAVIARFQRRAKRLFSMQWAVLAITLFLFAVDEACEIHEKLAAPVRLLFGIEDQSFILYAQRLGVFNFSWVVPALIGIAGFGCYLLKFLAHLPKSTRWEFVVAAAIFFGGAVGMEMVGGAHSELYGQKTALYKFYTTVEEGMEMAGSLLLIRALLRHISSNYGSLMLEFRPHLALPKQARPIGAQPPSGAGPKRSATISTPD